MAPPYELYYWPTIPGRGEVIRLVLEDAGVPYRDVAREEGIDAVLAARKGKLGEPRPFAPPVLRHGSLVLSQSAVIVRYLAERHGLAPDSDGERAIAQQHILGWNDLLGEVHDTHHPISVGLPYEDQRDAAKLRAGHFLDGRLGTWLQHFERVVEHGEGQHLAPAISYPDLMARVVLRGIEHAFPNAFATHRPRIPQLLALIERVEARPNIAAYLASPRALPFNEHGIFRHYPELDL